jgi:toxin YoeB
MRYKISFAPEADKNLKKYKKSNPIALKKIIRFIPELEEHPRTDTGHPEPLIKGNSTTYSRRINGKDHIIYDIYDEQ